MDMCLVFLLQLVLNSYSVIGKHYVEIKVQVNGEELEASTSTKKEECSTEHDAKTVASLFSDKLNAALLKHFSIAPCTEQTDADTTSSFSLTTAHEPTTGMTSDSTMERKQTTDSTIAGISHTSSSTPAPLTSTALLPESTTVPAQTTDTSTHAAETLSSKTTIVPTTHSETSTAIEITPGTTEETEQSKLLADGWTSFNSSYWYKVVTDREVNYTTAKANCKDLGGRLISAGVRDTSVYGKITPSLQQGNIRYWIGFDDLETDGQWVWSDGQQDRSRVWYKNEPSNGTVENCAAVKQEIGWKAIDVPCDRNYYSICEIILDEERKTVEAKTPEISSEQDRKSP